MKTRKKILMRRVVRTRRLSGKQRETGATRGKQARVLEAREGEAYACDDDGAKAPRPKREMSVQTLVVVSRRRPGLHQLYLI